MTTAINFQTGSCLEEKRKTRKALCVVRLKATVAILENKLHALLLTAARCLKERPHKALLYLTTSTTSSFVCWKEAAEKQLYTRYGIMCSRLEILKRYIGFSRLVSYTDTCSKHYFIHFTQLLSFLHFLSNSFRQKLINRENWIPLEIYVITTHTYALKRKLNAIIWIKLRIHKVVLKNEIL